MEKKSFKVYRHEIKFILSSMEYSQLRRLIGAFAGRDENARTDKGYYIRSLYFDTLTNLDYKSKIMGLSERKKIRLRIYDVSAETVKLEIKNKENDYSVKETSIITRADALNLMQGRYDILLKYNDAVCKKVYNNFINNIYMPKIIVDYDREAYSFPIENIRLTFDKGVRVSKNTDMFCNNAAMCSVLSCEQIILEVKFDGFLPEHIRNALSSAHMQRMSISKYCMARELLG